VTNWTDPRCETCEHPWSKHYLRSPAGTVRYTGCQIRKAKQWCEETRSYGKMEPCCCPGYTGQKPIEIPRPGSCPHEFVKGSNQCSACNRVIPQPKQANK
jgi:hypothetical protein